MGRNRDWDEDDDDYDDRPVRRGTKPGTKSSLVLGLSIGGGILLLTVIVVVIVLTSGKRSRPNDDTARPGGDAGAAPMLPGGAPGGTILGKLKKPRGFKFISSMESVEDPSVVDRVWARLVGRWDPVDQSPGYYYEFRPDYVYQSISTDPKKPTVFNDPVTEIRDVTGFLGGEKVESYMLRYHEYLADGSQRTGGTSIVVLKDGTAMIDNWRFRRTKK